MKEIRDNTNKKETSKKHKKSRKCEKCRFRRQMESSRSIRRSENEISETIRAFITAAENGTGGRMVLPSQDVTDVVSNPRYKLVALSKIR